MQHIGNHKVLEDDQVFLHWQERVFETAGGSAAAEQAFALPTSADVYVKALHRWVNRQGGGPFAGRPLPPRQDVEVLMDRYHSHTKHCRSCSGALRRIRSLRPWLWGSLWLSAVLIGAAQLSWLFWLGIGLAALSGLSLRQTSRWQRGLLVGDCQAPRNQRI